MARLLFRTGPPSAAAALDRASRRFVLRKYSVISCCVDRRPPSGEAAAGVVSLRRRVALVSRVCLECRSTAPPPSTVTLVLTFLTLGAGAGERRARLARPAVPVWAAVSRADQEPEAAERVRPPPPDSPAGSADSHLIRPVFGLTGWLAGERPELQHRTPPVSD